jgi:hypothetical protein
MESFSPCRHIAESVITLPTRRTLKVLVHDMKKATTEALAATAVHRKNGTIVSLEKVEAALRYLVANNPYV